MTPEQLQQKKKEIFNKNDTLKSRDSIKPMLNLFLQNGLYRALDIQSAQHLHDFVEKNHTQK